jgi:hypothetical protein
VKLRPDTQIKHAVAAMQGKVSDTILGQRKAVLEEAVTWLGTPFHHGAGVKGAGADCAAIALSYVAVLGDKIFPNLEFEKEFPLVQWHLHEQDEFYIKRLYEHGFIDIQEEDKLPADVVLTRVGRVFAHGAILFEWPIVIQAESAPAGLHKVTLATAEANWFLTDRDFRFFSLKVWR